jgi:hypothetical protein
MAVSQCSAAGVLNVRAAATFCHRACQRPYLPGPGLPGQPRLRPWTETAFLRPWPTARSSEVQRSPASTVLPLVTRSGCRGSLWTAAGGPARLLLSEAGPQHPELPPRNRQVFAHLHRRSIASARHVEHRRYEACLRSLPSYILGTPEASQPSVPQPLVSDAHLATSSLVPGSAGRAPMEEAER